MKIWQFLRATLQAEQRAILLYVLDNKGSSPGRKGFKMAVSENGQFIGTIGGGIMEVKLLELAKHKLEWKDTEILIKQQFHDKKHTNNQSGLICSGEQTVAIIPLEGRDLSLLQKIIDHSASGLTLGISKNRIEIISDSQNLRSYQTIFVLNQQKRVHVFGAGHVGHALTQVLSLLDYHILLYDDRPDLQGFKDNPFADEIHVIDYDQLGRYCSFDSDDTVVIVTTSYRSDKVVLKQLFQKDFFFIGMMGSDAKIAKLYEELENDGIGFGALSHVVAPIGVQILSKTAMEIAISVAGQIILKRNEGLPTGRRTKK